MCGICGIYNYRNGETAQEALLESMLECIFHRGPDEGGSHYDNTIAMGMRRLSIIDLSSGKQPIYNEDNSICIVFNGEIYNYLDLRKSLIEKGHQFRTNSDTEVIVHLYEEHGIDCIKHLRGMFGLSLWDSNTQTLLIARDHLGIKPIYYTDCGGRLIYSSEIKAILKHPEVTASVNVNALSDFLSLRYVPAPQTLFENIHVLLPGHRMICTPDQIHIEQYWDVEFSEPAANEIRTEAEYAEEFEHLIRDAVKMRLMSDVPFGAFLSGGVDSSTIVALMSEYLDHPVKTFSVGFEGSNQEQSFSELPFARMVAEHYKTDHHEVMVTSQDFINLTEKIAYHLDQPLADYAEVAYYKVCELASENVKMVLTGEGGDELFAGYGRYSAEKLIKSAQIIPNKIVQMGVSAVNVLPGMRRPKAALYAMSLENEAERHINWIPNFNLARKADLLTNELKHQLNGHKTADAFEYYLNHTQSKDTVNRMLYVDTKLWLPDYLLSRGDKLTMSVSIEGRVPLLDYKLVEFAAKLPPDLKINNGTHKYLLKNFSRKLLPADVIDRKKKGFPVPLPVWLRQEANEMMRDLLSPQAIKQRGYFEPSYIKRLIKEHETSFADHATMLYGLINLELWHRRFID